jgi:TPR repeat protein
VYTSDWPAKEKKRAKTGDGYLYLTLGQLYETGIGFEQDLTEAFKCYRRAARWGAGFAQAKLGQFFHLGMGTRKNHVEAYKWYLIAREWSGPEAKDILEAVAGEMRSDEIQKAHRLAAQFIPTRARG